jgi:hypothetical protein
MRPHPDAGGIAYYVGLGGHAFLSVPTSRRIENAYPRYRLIVTYFIEKKRCTVELFGTKLTTDEAIKIMQDERTR